MNTLMDIKWYRLLFIVAFVLTAIILVGILGIQTINSGNEIQMSTLETVAKTAAKSNGHIAPTLLQGIDQLELGELKIDTNSMIFTTTDTYDSLIKTEQVSDTTLKNLIGDGNLKIITFWTDKTWETYILNKNGSGLKNNVKLSKEATRWIGHNMSALAIWPVSNEKASQIIKSYFPRASKVSLGDDKYIVVMEMVGVNDGLKFSRDWTTKGAGWDTGDEHGGVNNWNPTNWSTSNGVNWGSTSTEDPLGLGWDTTESNENDEGNYIWGFTSGEGGTSGGTWNWGTNNWNGWGWRDSDSNAWATIWDHSDTTVGGATDE